MDLLDSDGTTNSNNEWVAPISEVIPEVRGTKWEVGGYNTLEMAERRAALESMSAHQVEVRLWYRALTLYVQSQFDQWDLESDSATEGEFRTSYVQMDLLGLGLSSAKSAIDSLMVGYYSVAFATIRHMAESVLQCYFLLAFPGKASLWYPNRSTDEVKTPSAVKMKNELVKHLKRMPAMESQSTYFDAIYTSIDLMSKGSHPTGAGLVQVQSTGPEISRQFGATYDRYLTLTGFDHGLLALLGLLEILEGEERMTEEVAARFHHWRAELDAFRSTLNDDPAVQAFQNETASIPSDSEDRTES
jgi:hypothetical protein